MTDEHDNIEHFEQLVGRYFAMSEQVSGATIDASKALFDLREMDDQLAALLDTTVAVRGVTTAEPLQYVNDDVTIMVNIARGVIDVVVQSRDVERVVVESADGPRELVVDAAGGASVQMQGPARVRVRLANGSSVVTDPFIVPPAF